MCVPECIQKTGHYCGRAAGRRPFGQLECSSYFRAVCHGISPKWLSALCNKSYFSCWPYHICMLGNSSMGARAVIVLLGLVLRTLIDITHSSDLKHSHGCASLEQRRKAPPSPHKSPETSLDKENWPWESPASFPISKVFILSIPPSWCVHIEVRVGQMQAGKTGPKKTHSSMKTTKMSILNQMRSL